MLTVDNMKVSWRYSRDEVPFFTMRREQPVKLSVRTSSSRTVTRSRDITTCEISVDDKTVAVASVVRGWNDKQCYETARKISLKRATEVEIPVDSPELFVPALTKEQRKAIWEAYRTSTKVPRWNVNK